MKPEVVEATSVPSPFTSYPASSVLILGEEDAQLADGNANYWLAKGRRPAQPGPQGFTVKVDPCARNLTGVQLKNLGRGISGNWATKAFKVSGSKKKTGPWQNLVQDEFIDTTRNREAYLKYFKFAQPVELQYLKFEMVSFWGRSGGGPQYFAPIPVLSKQHQTSVHEQICL